jgi:hypothetical protein
MRTAKAIVAITAGVVLVTCHERTPTRGVEMVAGLGVSEEELSFRDWRDVWEITLTASPPRSFPESLEVELRNHGAVRLRGANLIFNIYTGEGMFGWAIEEALRRENLVIPPGESIRRRVDVSRLRFKNIQGKPIATAKARRRLNRKEWTIQASLTDLGTRKPSFESSFLVWSNHVSIPASTLQ